MKLWLLSVPLTLLAVALSLLVVSKHEATSKVSWTEVRGAPIAFVVLTEYRWPCYPENRFCIRYLPQVIYFEKLVADFAFWYGVTYGALFVFSQLYQRHLAPQ